MENISIKKHNKSSLEKFKQLIFVFEDVFEREKVSIPQDDYLVERLSTMIFFVFVATHNNKVLAGLTSYGKSIAHFYYKF